MPFGGAADCPLLLRLRYLEENDMTEDRIKDLIIYYYIMHMMENCTELNEIVKDDIKGLKKYFNENLNIDIKNVAFDVN